MILQLQCAGCDRPGVALCTTCRFALVSRPVRDAPGGVVAAMPFTGRARSVVLSLKYRNRRSVARHVAGLLVNRLVQRSLHREVDVVTWAPTSGSRRRGRGFDQGELIARTVARQLGLPCRRLVERDGHGGAQTGRSRRERLTNQLTFRVHRRAAGRRILVVDDVVTTGATLQSVQRALERAGATHVVLAAVAATPAPGHAVRPRLRRPDEGRLSTAERPPVVVRAA